MYSAMITLANNTEENLLNLLLGAAAVVNLATGWEVKRDYIQKDLSCASISLQAHGGNGQIIYGAGRDFLTIAALTASTAGFRIEAAVAGVPSAPMPIPLAGPGGKLTPSMVRLICPGGASQKLYVCLYPAL